MRPCLSYLKRELICFLVFFLPAGFAAAQEDFRVFPYLQNPAPDAMTIIWFSEVNAPGMLSYGTLNSEAKTDIQTEPLPAEELAYTSWEDTTFFGGQAPPAPFRHRVRIENLEPAMTYEYTVTQGTHSFSSTFRTTPLQNTAIRFIVYGDPETEPESTGKFTDWVDPANDSTRPYLTDQTTGYRNNLEVIKSRRPDLVFIAGDLVETGGEQRDWDEFWLRNAGQDSSHSIAGEVPVMAVLGNHDYYEGPYLDEWDQPGSERAVSRFLTYFESPANQSPNVEQEGRYYSLKYGPVMFIVLDVCNNDTNGSGDDTNYFLLGEKDPLGGNAPDFGPGSRQYQWLEERLAEARTDSLFTFVIFHHAPYSSGLHNYLPGVENADNHPGNPVRVLTPLFMQYGVDAVFSGHDEIWERSEVSGLKTTPEQQEEMHTIHFYDVGTGGDGLRGPVSKFDNPFQKFLAHTDAPEIWEKGILKSGGKHYGHLEVDIVPGDANTWQAILKPVYIFPLFNSIDSVYSGYERRVYDDEVVLTRQFPDISIPVGITSFSDATLSARSYPNPFRSETTIEYFLPEPSPVTVTIFDIYGKVVRVVESGNKSSGLHNITWDSMDERGNAAAPGVYFFRIQTGSGQFSVSRMVLIK